MRQSLLRATRSDKRRCISHCHNVATSERLVFFAEAAESVRKQPEVGQWVICLDSGAQESVEVVEGLLSSLTSIEVTHSGN